VARPISIKVLNRFAKAKNMPIAGRVSGGGPRTVIYRHPDRVRVFRGKPVNGTRSASYPKAG
jgi:hypothetical protein